MTKKMYDSEISLKQIYNKSKIRKQKVFLAIKHDFRSTKRTCIFNNKNTAEARAVL